MTLEELFALIEKQHIEINKHDLATINRIINAYGQIYQRLMPYIRNIEFLIQLNEGMTVAALKRSAEYSALINFINRELADFIGFAKVELDTANTTAVQIAVAHVNDFFNTLGIRPEIVTADAANVLINYLDPEGELVKRIGMWAPHVVDEVIQSLVQGINLGRNPRVIASDLRKAFGVGLTDALRTARTAQIYAYREATRLNYIANSDVVKGWIWFAVLNDDRTCMSCRAMHGTVHPLTEVLNDHYCGRCSELPYIEGVNYGLEDGEEHFNGLSESKQIELMGRGRWEAYKSGKFQFSQLSKIYDDPVYGDMRGETPLKDLLNEH
jgi:SPP1 gp7 family putative phage head morphogenesis protein